MYISFPPGRGSTLPPPSSPADRTPGVPQGAARAAGVAAGVAAGGTPHAGELEAAAVEIDELSRAVLHLTRSNEELRAALAETPGDPDFEAAIVENVDVIAAKLAKLAELKKVYSAMLGGAGGAGGAAPEEAEDAAEEAAAAGTHMNTAHDGLDAAGGLML